MFASTLSLGIAKKNAIIAYNFLSLKGNKFPTMKNYLNVLKNTFNYQGKSSVNEFWLFVVVNFLIGTLIYFVEYRLTGQEMFQKIYTYLMLLPLLGVGVRRLRDAGFNGWMFLIPGVNMILAALPTKETAITEVNQKA